MVKYFDFLKNIIYIKHFENFNFSYVQLMNSRIYILIVALMSIKLTEEFDKCNNFYSF